MKLMPVGIDIANNVFQVHHVDEETGEIVNKAIKRAKFLEYFVNRVPCLIGMEACGGAHHWARHLTKMGHQVKLMPGEYVKAFNIRNKKDSAEARAIWLAVQQPSKFVVVKTEMQQAMLTLHRQREQLQPQKSASISAERFPPSVACEADDGARGAGLRGCEDLACSNGTREGAP